MAFRGLCLFTKISRSVCIMRYSTINKSSINTQISCKPKEYKTEDNFIYLEDPDSFGTLNTSTRIQVDAIELEDEGDIKEHKFLDNIPMKYQKLTTKQYADLIKQYLNYKRLKEAIDVLEVRMLTQDRVKPENYIYNILIGACADAGYTKKAFKLFNDMKRRALKPTGDTYTCLFTACANSPWVADGLQHAHHLRNLMKEKGVTPNLTNYNSMIKAFGRCGDLITAFKIVDEMMTLNIHIRVHTFNHLLHACISDKNHGLRHALIVWRKMLNGKEKPNIYSFNLMLKCVKDCNLGTNEDLKNLINLIPNKVLLPDKNGQQILQNEKSTEKTLLNENTDGISTFNQIDTGGDDKDNNNVTNCYPLAENDSLIVSNSIQLVENVSRPRTEERTAPNLLSKVINLNEVLSLQEVKSPQDKFAIVGGQDDFLNEMAVYSVKPDIKTFTQMLPLIEDSLEAENKLIQTMKSLDVKADIEFYNMLIKKKCLRSDYDDAFNVKKLIKQESEFRKKRYPNNKKLQLKVNIMTYGAWAMACKTQEIAEKLLSEMKEDKLKVNIAILGTMLRQGTANNNFDYVLYIMNIVKEENIKVNDIFIKHLESFNDKCANFIQMENNGPTDCNKFKKCFMKYLVTYEKWLKDINAEEALKPEHPWSQFRENYPETMQHSNVKIVEPKRFYKRNRKYINYKSKI